MDRQTLASKIWSACDIMRRDKLYLLQYIEQVSWMLFLKLFEQIERKSSLGAQVFGQEYQPTIEEKYHWSNWSNLDAKELFEFVNEDLFPYLKSIHGSPLKNIISALFEDLRNYMHSPYNFKDVVNLLNDLDFSDPKDTHVISQVYEDLLLRMGQEGGTSGEFYTPRAIIKLIVQMIDPKIGETIFDPFAGSGGFLAEGFNYLKQKQSKMTAQEYKTIQEDSFYGNEAKSLPFLLGIMNMLLHGLESPHYFKTNTFAEDLTSLTNNDRYDIILTNPPFGGIEGKEVLRSFPLKSADTELLALYYIMKKLKTSGRAGVVLPEGVLFKTGGAYTAVKKELTENFNLFAIVSLPIGVFANVSASGQGPKTSILFFEKGKPTEKTWYCELTTDKKFTKKNPIRDEDTADVYSAFMQKTTSDKSGFVPVEEIVKNNYNLSAKKISIEDNNIYRSPKDLIKEINENEKEVQSLLFEIQNLIK